MQHRGQPARAQQRRLSSSRSWATKTSQRRPTASKASTRGDVAAADRVDRAEVRVARQRGEHQVALGAVQALAVGDLDQARGRAARSASRRGSPSPAPPRRGRAAADGHQHVAGPVAQPLARSGTRRWRRPPGCRCRRTRAGRWRAGRSPASRPGCRPPEPLHGRGDLGHVRGLQDDAVRAAPADPVEGADQLPDRPGSRKWKRERITAGRSDGSSASSAARTAVENRSGACITMSTMKVRPPSRSWVRCRSRSAIACSHLAHGALPHAAPAVAGPGRPWPRSGRPGARSPGPGRGGPRRPS